MIRFLCATVCMFLASGPAPAQSLSPEDIARMLDEQAATPNPYAALLNDPDPARSMGAMRIMMESGDPALVEMAVEFGLLASNPDVRTQAANFYMATEPFLDFVVACNESDDSSCAGWVASRLGGTNDGSNLMYFRSQVGSYDPEQECYVWKGSDNCAFSFRPTGIFLSGSYINAKISVNDNGDLVGLAKISSVSEQVPTRIQILR